MKSVAISKNYLIGWVLTFCSHCLHDMSQLPNNQKSSYFLTHIFSPLQADLWSDWTKTPCSVLKLSILITGKQSYEPSPSFDSVPAFSSWGTWKPDRPPRSNKAALTCQNGPKIPVAREGVQEALRADHDGVSCSKTGSPWQCHNRKWLCFQLREEVPDLSRDPHRIGDWNHWRRSGRGGWRPCDRPPSQAERGRSVLAQEINGCRVPAVSAKKHSWQTQPHPHNRRLERIFCSPYRHQWGEKIMLTYFYDGFVYIFIHRSACIASTPRTRTGPASSRRLSSTSRASSVSKARPRSSPSRSIRRALARARTSWNTTSRSWPTRASPPWTSGRRPQVWPRSVQAMLQKNVDLSQKPDV